MVYFKKLVLIFACFTWNILQAQQTNTPATSFSHIYIVIDTAAYNVLSQNKFCTDTLFYYSKGAVNTDQGSWDGQYFEGDADYREVSQPDTVSEMSVGDIVPGCMLHQPYEAKINQRQYTN
ncbi:MAG: hypothetical protein QM768_03415 [Agriterribacter sp.]